MNIKSLLLGSAAALLAVSGAKAADAVVVADPEPVEYVRVCDVYGAGYFYIPGTETCLKIGGYVRFQTTGGDAVNRVALSSFDDDVAVPADEIGTDGRARWVKGVGGAIDHIDGSANDVWSTYSRLYLSIDANTETELGTLKGSSGVYFTYGSDGTSATLDYAWVDLAGFRAGMGDSAFTSWTDYTGSFINDDLILEGPYSTNFISYTFTGGNGFSAFLALEEGNSQGDGRSPILLEDAFGGQAVIVPDGHDYTADSYLPHIVAGAKFTQGWGGVSGVAAYDSSHEVFAAKLRLDVKVNDMFSAWVMGGWGENDLQFDSEASAYFGFPVSGQFNNYKTWGGEWAVWGGIQAKVSEKATINVMAAYDDDEEFAAAANVTYEVVPGLTVKPELFYKDYGSLVSPSLAADDDAWGGSLRIQRSF